MTMLDKQGKIKRSFVLACMDEWFADKENLAKARILPKKIERFLEPGAILAFRHKGNQLISFDHKVTGPRLMANNFISLEQGALCSVLRKPEFLWPKDKQALADLFLQGRAGLIWTDAMSLQSYARKCNLITSINAFPAKFAWAQANFFFGIKVPDNLKTEQQLRQGIWESMHHFHGSYQVSCMAHIPFSVLGHVSVEDAPKIFRRIH